MKSHRIPFYLIAITALDITIWLGTFAVILASIAYFSLCLYHLPGFIHSLLPV